MPNQILDYASPGRSGKFRVGARSIIGVMELDATTEIREKLERRGLAATLIVVDLLLIALMVGGDSYTWRRLWLRHEVEWPMIFVVIVAAIMLTLIVYVVKHNWATTTIIADREQLTIQFRDPFTRKQFKLNRYALHQISVVQANPTSPNELLILGGDLEMRLFTGHPWAEIIRIRDDLSRRLELAPEAVVAVALDALPVAEVVE